MKSLDVLVDGKLIGTLFNREPLVFAYSDECLNGLLRSPFSGVIPLAPGEIATPAVLAYFENLLPEGDQRRSLEEKHHVTSVFGLLETVGWDTAGAIVLQPTGTSPSGAEYSRQTWQGIAEIIAGHDVPKASVKASVSGAQYKILLSLDEDNSPLIPIGASPTTHILKPDIQRAGQKIWASAANETMIMRAAGKCGLPVAEVAYVAQAKSCLVTRYDRVKQGQVVHRLHQSDLCQLLKIPSGVKYESDGGPGFARCYALVKQTSINPIEDCENLLKWLFFNLYTGNNDSHAKNLSMLHTEDGPRLAPFYDLMCTSVYPGFSTNFAFKIGGTYKPGEISPADLQALADSINVSQKYMLKLAQELLERVKPALAEAFQDLKASFGYSDQAIVQRLSYEISKLCKSRGARLLQPAGEPPPVAAPARMRRPGP